MGKNLLNFTTSFKSRPFGEARYTGQREMLAGLYDYRARWYEPALALVQVGGFQK